MKRKRWYRLDNIGKFYASIENSTIPKVFRYSAIFIDEIDANLLQIALKNTIEIYPNFNVNLKKGMFWYYLDETNKINKVEKENLPICFKIYNNSDDFLYRVSYYKRKINLEVSHILSDGRGSIEFFKLLISNYAKIKYDLKIDTTKNNVSVLEKTEDSFSKYYQKFRLTRKEYQTPYIYKNRKFKNQTLFLECNLNVNDVLKLAHKYDTTLTGLLVSMLIFSFKDELKLTDINKYIKIDIPVDLRNYFKSSSSMNFFGLTTISYKFNSKEDTLKDIVNEVNRQLKENLKKEKICERVNLFVSFEKNWICKFIPLFVKNIVLNIADMITNQKSSSCLSNIGVIKLDKDVENKLQSISVLTSTNGFQFTICTLKDNLCIGISSRFINNDVIKNFCRYFSSNNIDVSIDVSEVE